MKRTILAALVLILAIPAAAFAAGTAERPSKKQVTVAQSTQTKKETTQNGAANSTAKKSSKKARKAKKAGARTNVAPRTGTTVKPDSSVK